jgi:hypothetical protein
VQLTGSPISGMGLGSDFLSFVSRGHGGGIALIKSVTGGRKGEKLERNSPNLPQQS